MSTDNHTPLLSVRSLNKSYAVPVLADVDFDLYAGEVHALVGANGAGKTTLARIISGLTEADSGAMSFSGEPYSPATKADAERAGIHMVLQEPNLISTLTIAENLFLNRMPRRFGFVSYGEMSEETSQALSMVGLQDLDPTMLVAELGVGQQQLVEIAQALSRECRLLILDEPTAALTDPEIDLLFEHVGRLKDEGVGIIYISHRMEEIRRVSDRVTVLRDGRVVGTHPSAEISLDRIVKLMTGRDAVGEVDTGRREIGEVAMRVEGLCRGSAVRNVSFEVRRGEILGFAGLVGSGRTETMRAIFGADRPDAGQVTVGESSIPVKISQPRDAVRAGIGLIPEDRKSDGLLLPQPVRTNITLAQLRDVMGPSGWIDPERERMLTEAFSEALDVRYASIEQPVVELSGGNQQKVVIARWFMRDCDVLLFDEPTRGIDVAAKWTVYRLLGKLAERGKAIVVVSSDLPELMSICDRIAVMSAGKLAATFERGEWTQEKIMAAAISGYIERESMQEAG